MILQNLLVSFNIQEEWYIATLCMISYHCVVDIQKRVQVSTHRGRMATVAVHKPSVKKNMVTNKLIAENFAECWAKANRQLNIVSTKQLSLISNSIVLFIIGLL